MSLNYSYSHQVPQACAFLTIDMMSEHERPVLAPVVQRMDNAIHQINRYPVDKCL